MCCGNFEFVVYEGVCEQVAASGSTSSICLRVDIWYVYLCGNTCNIRLLHMQSFGGTRNDMVSINMDICL